ncbi:unnamed protein product [Absidia cylindrospora]
MSSDTSVEPPFSYNPGYKPTKSILKQRIPSSSPSWLTKFSSNDSLPQPQPSSPQQRTFGYFRKLINNSPITPNSSQPQSSTSSLSSSSTTTENDQDELSSAELKRVRFSVNQMTTEYFPYSPKDNDLDNLHNNNIDSTQTNNINNETPSTSIDNNVDTTDLHQTTNRSITTTPGKLISYYEAACKIKEEPLLDVLMGSLLSHQQAATLTHIDLTNQVLTRRAIEPLADVMCLDFGLEKLTLKNCQLEDEALKVILHSLLVVNRLQHLDLSDNKKIQVNGFKYISIFIKNASSLETIDLSGTNPDKKSIQYISQALSYTTKTTTTNDTTATASKLTSLVMDNCNLRQQQLESLSNVIRRSSVSYLSLRGNRINQQGAICIGVMLRDYDDSTGGIGGLQHLILDNNDIRQGVQYIAQALRRNQSLRLLSITDCKLDVQSCVSIAEALKYNQSLESLDISSNPLCDDQQLEGIHSLKQSLYCNHSLSNLALAETGLGSEAAVALAECLPENTSLCRLDLSRNPAIDLAGILALLSGLKLNTTMVFLDVNVPANDRDMVKAQSEMAALCTKNAQTSDENKSRTPSLNLVDPSHPSITTTQATARLTLQERLAAVTKGKNSSRTNSLRSVSSIENIPRTGPPSATPLSYSSQHQRTSTRSKIQTNFDVEIYQVGLLEEMLHADEDDSTTTQPPDDTIKQVYLQCRKGLLNLNRSIPHLMESEQLVDLLSLNDRLTTAITRYEEFEKKSQQAASDILSPPLPPRTNETSMDNTNTHEQSQPQLDTASAMTDDDERSTSPFEIGDADDDDDDDDGGNDDQVGGDVSAKQEIVDGDAGAKDIHELRKEKEMEEGEAFKHAKDLET